MRSIVLPVLQILSISLVVSSMAVAAEPANGKVGPNDWPWWRGPTRDGVARDSGAPVKWSATDNVAWKAAVPGRGHSSPTVVGSLVVMQTAAS